jgi:hypothetical protein
MAGKFRFSGIRRRNDRGLLRCGNVMQREKGLIERHDGG